MADTIGLLAEAVQLARDLGYVVREEPLGDAPGGGCTIGGRQHVLLNVAQPPAERLDRLVRVLAEDSRVAGEPMSRLLAGRLREVRQG